MIKAEQQVTNLETSQAFRTLGVPQGRSYFIWVVSFNPEKISDVYIDYKNAYVLERKWQEEASRCEVLCEVLCDAYTQTELFYLIGLLRKPSRRRVYEGYVKLISNALEAGPRFRAVNMIDELALLLLDELTSQYDAPQPRNLIL